MLPKSSREDRNLLEAPMFAATDQSSDDLGHAALLALMGVGHQALHVRLQQGQERVIEVPEKSLGSGKSQETSFAVKYQPSLA